MSQINWVELLGGPSYASLFEEKIAQQESRYERKKSEIFFQPYTASLQTLSRVSSIVTAPIISAVLSAGFFIYSLVNLLTSCFYLLFGTTELAKENIKNSYDCLGSGFILLAAVFVSPVINLFDLIAGAVVSLRPEPVAVVVALQV